MQFIKKEIIIYYFLLLSFWILLSGDINLEIIIIGSIASIFVIFFSRALIFKNEEVSLFSFRSLYLLFIFIINIVIEIFKSNIQVAKIVLNPKLPIKPSFVKVKKNFTNDLDKVIYSNAVTLTPGTLTIDIEEDGFIIHVLTDENANGLKENIIEKSIQKWEE